MGLSIKGKKNQPKKEPFVLIANHNSHLDVIVLMSLFPLSKISQIHPIAAQNYFMKTCFLRWFSKSIVETIPFERKMERKTCSKDPFEKIKSILSKGEIMIIFPEESRLRLMRI